MKRIQFYGWFSKDFIHILPSMTLINYANQYDLQICWLVFGCEITIKKKGWF